jgi:hypothetical protein
VPFEIRKILDVGVSNPVVARLGIQIGDLLEWSTLDEAKRKEIA